MLFSNTLLLITGAARLALGAPSEVTTFTFPEGSGVEGTVKVDTSRVEARIELFTKAALEGAGVDGISSHNASIGHLVASTVAGDPPTQKECDDCWSVCIPLCLLPPACIG